MKNITSILILILGFNDFLLAQDMTSIEQDKKAIEEIVERFYFDVVFGGKDLKELADGFHNEFNMYVLFDNQIDKRTLQSWADRLAQVRAKNAQAKKINYSHEVKLLDVTGPTGMIKIEIYEDKKLKYTDYLSLYKFQDGWKIMTKLFTQH